MPPEKTFELWADRQNPRSRVAVVDGHKLVALEVDNDRMMPRAGARYVAKVARFNPTLGIADLDLGSGQTAFLNLKRKPIEQGKLVTVEWVAPAIGEKQAVVKLLNTTPADGEPRLLQDGPDAYERALKYGAVKHARISTPLQQKRLAELGLEAELHTGKPDLFELIDLNTQIDDLRQRVVELPGGGSLVFDRTEVGHVIDVNSGTATNLPELNRVALNEVARQIRLRNLSGIILIDVVGERKRNPATLLDVLTAAVKRDTCQVDVYGMTKLGLVECTRVRRGYELSGLLA